MKYFSQNNYHQSVAPVKNVKGLFSRFGMQTHKNHTGGFTMLELLVTIAIYIMMVSIVLANYRTFNTNALFVNASEDVILALRQAQVYGVGTKANPVTCGVQASAFACPYGVYINMADPNGLTIFVDLDGDKKYTSGFDAIVQKTSWMPAIVISSIQCGAGACFGNKMNITFTRPTPDAFITDDGGAPNRVDSGTITLKDINSNRTSTITITNAGQISIQ